MFLSKHLKVFFVLGVLLATTFVLGVVDMYTQDDMPEEEVTVFNITMKDYQFVVEGQELNAPIQLEVGKPYTLHFIHEGADEHEVLIGEGAIEVAADIHHDFTTSLLEDVEVSIVGQMNDNDFVIGVPGLNEFEMNPGQELSISFTLPEDKIGDWEMGCFVYLDKEATEENPSPTHYDAGMHLTINVVAGE